ncbi:VOC family protein [Brevibacterium salitolerans]|uniref:VOC family protein n=1 Tax=Brevibacterium salitolerans TaxID=1403566 RepID=UPI0031D6AB62
MPARPTASGIPSTFDHLVVAVPELAAGVAEFEELTGAKSVPGGSHPGRGTANHLVPLIPRGWGADSLTYLEILGPDPAQDPALAAAQLAGFDRMAAQRWAVHPDDLDATVAAADEAGVDYGAVFDMARDTPEGGRLEWRLTRRAPLAYGGAQPFLIDWAESPHPARTLRQGAGDPASASETGSAAAPGVSGAGEAALTLERLEFFAPDPAALATALGVLAASGAGDGSFTVEEAAHPGFRAVLSGPRGEAVLETPVRQE